MRLTRRVLCLSAALLLCAPSGCKKERPVPPGPGGLPPLPGQKATDPTALMHPPDRAAMPPDHPPVLQGAQPVPDPAAAPEPGARIQGIIQIADRVRDRVRPGATIFLAARAFPQAGPPLAVKRLTAGTWPLPFEISEADVMMAGTALRGKVTITARVDQDGDAMTRQVGDVEGASQPVEVGASGVEVLLNTVRTEAAGAPSPPGLGLPPGHP